MWLDSQCRNICCDFFLQALQKPRGSTVSLGMLSSLGNSQVPKSADLQPMQSLNCSSMPQKPSSQGSPAGVNRRSVEGQIRLGPGQSDPLPDLVSGSPAHSRMLEMDDL